MDITYNGNTSFFIKGKKASIALNPTQDMPKADVALLSKEGADVKAGWVVDWPGEYEISEVLIHAISVPHGESKTTIFQFEIDEVKFLYLPDLDHVLGDEEIQQVGDADVVLLPVGGNGGLDAKTAAKVYEEIEPKMVIPMQHSEGGYGPVADFLKEVGKTGLEAKGVLEVDKSKLPMDSTEFHLLKVA
ncbi:MBL fold metallo-hydrolase [Candidatus Peregrinibacteria bacterium]|jgi:L-ascorbate metabolism protein UlaG (beta-lactamase superfamily)|nr:MBL fold metallo-hydrolase [Candidatus Peregrinibacteria bacterium]